MKTHNHETTSLNCSNQRRSYRRINRISDMGPPSFRAPKIFPENLKTNKWIFKINIPPERGFLNIRRAISPLDWLVKEERRRPPERLTPLKIGSGTVPNRTVVFTVFKAAVNDRRKN
ncbi:hypothetical protein TNCV_2663321 [Trichonephila clavipes]|nr:hypothetical protein TNCV_2663321 [Trichonephila clavipes]